MLPQALLEAERTGQTWKQLGLLPAPHFHDKDGSVKVTCPGSLHPQAVLGCAGQ